MVKPHLGGDRVHTRVPLGAAAMRNDERADHACRGLCLLRRERAGSRSDQENEGEPCRQRMHRETLE